MVDYHEVSEGLFILDLILFSIYIINIKHIWKFFFLLKLITASVASKYEITHFHFWEKHSCVSGVGLWDVTKSHTYPGTHVKMKLIHGN